MSKIAKLGDGPAAPEMLVAKLSRAALEALVLRSLAAGSPIVAADLAPQSPPPPSAPKRPFSQNADLGPFFGPLDDDVLTEILAVHLCATARLRTLSAVSKGFRALEARLPWKALKLIDGSHGRTPHPLDTLWLAPGGFGPSLVAFVRDRATTLTTLSLNLRESPTDVREIARLVAAAPNVTDLSLSEKKIQAPVMKALAALPHLRKLKKLELGYLVSNKPDVFKLLSGAPTLEQLAIHNELSAEAFHQVCQSWRKARGGGTLLLHRLELNWRSSNTLLPSLANGCPDLNELHALGWDFDHIPQAVSLPRGLRRLRVELHGYDNSDRPKDEWCLHKQYRNADNAAIVKRILSACPNLKRTAIYWSKLSGREFDHATKTAFRLGDALAAAPATLESLYLGNMHVDDEGIASLVHVRTKPATLRKLKLYDCIVGDDTVKRLVDAGVQVKIYDRLALTTRQPSIKTVST